MIFQNCLKFHSPITDRDREITSDNFEIQPQIMLLPMQISYKFPIYECTSAFFVHVLGKCCLVSQISSQRSRLYVCLNYGVEWRVGEGSKGFNKWSSHVYSRGSLWRVLLQHTTPWGQLIHWPLTTVNERQRKFWIKLGLQGNCPPMPTLTQRLRLLLT